MDWNLAEIRAVVRDLTGYASTNQMADATVNSWINEYYQNQFRQEAKLPRHEEDFTQATAATDTGEYSISTDILELKEPVTINESPAMLFQDRNKFFDEFPESLGAAYCVTAPTLAIGTSSTAAVANSAFTYNIENYSYSAAAAETALSGDTVPQSKYGAWRLEVSAAGTISVVEADDNATGYATPGLAIDGLPQESSENACMGYVTAINTAGTFVPGTTGLDGAGVTDTYTDGYHSTRDAPYAILLDAGRGKLYARPKPDDIYQIKATAVSRPDALSADDSVPTDAAWGKAIALGASQLIFQLVVKDYDEAAILGAQKDAALRVIRRRALAQFSQNQVSSRRF